MMTTGRLRAIKAGIGRAGPEVVRKYAGELLAEVERLRTVAPPEALTESQRGEPDFVCTGEDMDRAY